MTVGLLRRMIDNASKKTGTGKTEERRNRQDLIEVFKICNGLSRIKLNELFI